MVDDIDEVVQARQQGCRLTLAMYCSVPKARDASVVVTGVGPAKSVGFLVPLPLTKAAPSPARQSFRDRRSQPVLDALKNRSSSDSQTPAKKLADAMPNVGATSARSGALVWLRVSLRRATRSRRR